MLKQFARCAQTRMVIPGKAFGGKNLPHTGIREETDEDKFSEDGTFEG